MADPDAARLASRVGRLLLASGADTAHALRRIDEVAILLGARLRRLVTAEGILVSSDGGAELHVRLGSAIPAMGADMGRTTAIERVLDTMRAGSRDIAAIDQALDAIEHHPSAYPAVVVILGVALTAASLARLFGAEWPVVAAACVAGAVSTALRLACARLRLNPLAATCLTALLSGLAAVMATRLAPGSSPIFALTAAGMILVPGVPLINGVRDLVAGHAGNAVVRLTIAAATILAIGTALALVGTLTGDPLPIDRGPGALPLAQDLLFAATAAAGYTTLFNVPLRAIPICILCGMTSHGLRAALALASVDVATGSFLGALAAGLIAQAAGHAFRAPPVAFAFPGIVAMIPGSYAFRAGIGGLHLMALGAASPTPLVAETLSLAITTVIVTIAIAIGLCLALALPLPQPGIQAGIQASIQE